MNMEKLRRDYGEVLWAGRKCILGLPISFTRYILTDNMLYTKIGFLNIKEDEIELYRIFDKKISFTLGQRIVGCGTITLMSKDMDNPEKKLISIKKPREVKKILDEVKEAENVMKDSEIQNNPELATNLNSQQTSEDEEEIKQEETVDNSLNEALQKEKLARDAWRKNSSSYELYQNYKYSIAERLEIQKEGETSEASAIDDYEGKKQAYEEVSSSKELIEQASPKSKEEIDTDLDDFEAEERRILNSKHFTDEQKKKMIEDLYTEFDKYTEENPEISGRHI